MNFEFFLAHLGFRNIEFTICNNDLIFISHYICNGIRILEMNQNKTAVFFLDLDHLNSFQQSVRAEYIMKFISETIY